MQVLAYAQGWTDVQAGTSEIGQQRTYLLVNELNMSMKKTVTLLASALLTGVIFWLAIYSMNVIQHVPDPMKRSLSIWGPLFTGVPVLIGVWLRRRRRNTDTE